MIATATLEALLKQMNTTIKRVGDRKTPFLMRYLDEPAKVKQQQFYWADESLRGYKDELVTAIASTGTTSVVVKSGTTFGRKRYITDAEAKTHIRVRVNGVDEIMKVNAYSEGTTTSTLTVARGQKGTSALASIPAGSEIIILPATAGDGATITGDHATVSSEFWNYVQDFHRAIGLTHRLQNIESVDDEARFAKQLAKMGEEVMKDAQHAFFHEQRATGTENGNPITWSGGLNWWANNFSNSLDQGGKALSFNILDDIMDNMINNGVDVQNMDLIVPVSQQRVLNNMKEARVVGGGTNQGDKTITNFVNRYEFSDKGVFNILLSTDLSKDEIYIVDKSRVSVRPMGKGLQYEAVDLAKTGKNDRKYLEVSLGFEVRNGRETLFHLKNLAN
jgi:hypothetical protein